ncbi:MAG: hypothetical protein RLZZ598_923 [Pseudomonadota bacterium]|jgi:glycosyltransferase involved in cell wall biosynthesis
MTTNDSSGTLTIGIIGTRGIPNRYGGFERFVELLVDDTLWQDHDVQFRVYGESPTQERNPWTRSCEVGLIKSERPLMYYARSANMAARECDILLCCGVGLSVFAWWPVFRGRALVVNPDGCEWRRTKWSRLGRLLIRAMYWPAIAAAQRIVIDAEALREDFGSALGNKARCIAYQAPEPRSATLQDTTKAQLALSRHFLLVIARLEPENNIHLILQAFHKLDPSEVNLVIVGGKSTPFYLDVLAGMECPRVRFVGALYDQAVLDELRSNCLAYLHGHSVGGTNPSLLEALATVRGHLICHDNKYNREVAADQAEYFVDETALAALLQPIVQGAATQIDDIPAHRTPTRDERFRPDTISRSYLELFEDIRAAR